MKQILDESKSVGLLLNVTLGPETIGKDKPLDARYNFNKLILILRSLGSYGAVLFVLMSICVL